MTAVTGKAFEMRYTVKHLMRRHGIAPAPCVVPLTAPQLHPMTLDGFASTTDLDLDCCRFRRHAFTLFERGASPKSRLRSWVFNTEQLLQFCCGKIEFQ